MAADSCPYVELHRGLDSFYSSRLGRSKTSCPGECSPAQQLAVFKRNVRRPKLNDGDRLFWIGLRMIWQDWKSTLLVVRPETVIAWHRQRFKRYWWRLSKPKQPGRPRTGSEIRKLIRTMAASNPTWGAPRVHGELKKLGYRISERTVSRWMPRKTGKPSQTWMTFLRNHVAQMVAVDFFTVPTIPASSAVCLRHSGARSSARSAFQRDGESNSQLDSAAGRGGVSRTHCTTLHVTRS
jgi:hypothetical protein